MEFEWDDRKSAQNRAKHDVSFEEAREVFEPDVVTLEIFDVVHSVCEDRFITIGPIRRGLVLVVWPSARKTSCGSSRRGGPRSERRSVSASRRRTSDER